MDNLLEFGSNVNIDFIAICDFESTTKSYKENDIVLSLKDIYATLYYNTKSHAAVSTYTELYYSEYSLAGITINRTPLNQAFYDLFSSEKLNNISLIKEENCVCLDGTLYILNSNATTDSVKVKDVEFEYEVHTNSGGVYITSDDFIDGQTYTVAFSALYSGHSFNMYSGDIDVPYLKMQIQFIGNEDKEDIEGYLIIDKARLIYQPNIDFSGNHVASCNLRCVVIDPTENAPKLVILDA